MPRSGGRRRRRRHWVAASRCVPFRTRRTPDRTQIAGSPVRRCGVPRARLGVVHRHTGFGAGAAHAGRVSSWMRHRCWVLRSALAHLPHRDSDGCRVPTERQLARADVVDMHRMPRVRPSAASVGRLGRSTPSPRPLSLSHDRGRFAREGTCVPAMASGSRRPRAFSARCCTTSWARRGRRSEPRSWAPPPSSTPSTASSARSRWGRSTA